MKKIILIAICWPLFSYPLYAQKGQQKINSSKIIIIKKDRKEKKFTIETKDDEVLINGKPSKEYKDEDISVITNNFHNGRNFLFAPGTENFHLLNTMPGEKKAFLGVTTEKTDEGAKITNISKGSAAEIAGLKEGDIITKVGNKKITDPDDLIQAITSYKPKSEVATFYKRDGKNGEVKVTLAERNAAKAFSFIDNEMEDFNFSMPKIAAIPHEPFAMSWGFGRGRLGIKIEDADNESGAKITDVYDESTAAKAGLKENDIITEVDGKKVKDVIEVKKELAAIKEKSSYNIKVKRNGADINVEVKIPKKINKADL